MDKDKFKGERGKKTMGSDPVLERLSATIDSLSAEFEKAKKETTYAKNHMNSEFEILQQLRNEYGNYKELADAEFNAARDCWDAGDRASAVDHSARGHQCRDEMNMLRSGLDSANYSFNDARDAFNTAKERQQEILADLKEARAEHKA